MTAHQNSRSAKHVSHRNALAAAIVLVGGAAFAAAGGIDAVREWLLTVEVNGERTQVALDEQGRGQFTLKTEDGGLATVQIEKGATDDGGEMAALRVHEVSDDGQVANVEKVLRRGPVGDPVEYTLDDLGDAQPFHTWTDADGQLFELYFVATADGSGSQLFMLSTYDEREFTIRLIGETRMSVQAIEPAVEHTRDGEIRITLNNGAGMEQVMAVRLGDAAEDLPPALDASTPGAQIRVRLDDLTEQE